MFCLPRHVIVWALAFTGGAWLLAAAMVACGLAWLVGLLLG